MHERRIVSRVAPRGRGRLVLVLLLGLLPALPAVSAAAEPDRQAHLRGALEGLEIAMVHLGELGWERAHTILERLADETRSAMREGEVERERDREQRAGGDGERAMAEKQVEVLRLALKVLREAERRDAADLVHRAIRAREVGLEGRRDEEAREIRRRQPRREQLIELLVLAEHLYREFDMPDRADMVSRMTEELWPPRDRDRRRAARPERERAGAQERETARRHIEIMRLGMPALREAGRRDTAELLEHAIHARELTLEGRRDPEAMEIRERAPNLGQTIEILNYSADLWREFGDEEKAGRLAELAAHMRNRRDDTRRERERGRREARERGDDREELMHHVELLQVRMHELAQELEELKARLRER